MTPIEEMVLITGEWYYKREWPARVTNAIARKKRPF